MEEICVLIAENKRKGFKRYLYERRTVSNLNVAMNIYTIFCPKSVFTARRLKKICSSYKFVYSNDGVFTKYCKRKTGSIIDFMPKLALTKIANVNKINLAEENIGLVIKNSKYVNINFLTELLKNVKYLCVYESDRKINEIIMEASGICAQKGKDFSEKILIFLDESIYFKVDGKIISDISISLPENLKNIFPVKQIIEDVLKCENAENILKNNKIKITDFTYA